MIPVVTPGLMPVATSTHFLLRMELLMQAERFPMKPFPVEQIERNVARFGALRGSADAYIDSRVPGCLRKKFNLIGLGVTENEVNPDLRPNIDMPAVGFNVGMLECENGNGTAPHAHQTEEVFMPLIGAWQVFWLDDGVERTLTLQPFDMVMWPTGCYRWFRYAGEGKGRLLTIIGGPDAGKVEYLPDHLATAQATGIKRNADGTILVTETA
jgi:mannose-6-phosphate isomerase-like protein (cupin superfamily)